MQRWAEGGWVGYGWRTNGWMRGHSGEAGWERRAVFVLWAKWTAKMDGANGGGTLAGGREGMDALSLGLVQWQLIVADGN